MTKQSITFKWKFLDHGVFLSTKGELLQTGADGIDTKVLISLHIVVFWRGGGVLECIYLMYRTCSWDTILLSK